jgi:hypothetical protein
MPFIHLDSVDSSDVAALSHMLYLQTHTYVSMGNNFLHPGVKDAIKIGRDWDYRKGALMSGGDSLDIPQFATTYVSEHENVT